MILRVRGYSEVSLKKVKALVRRRMLKSLMHKIRPYDRVLVPYLYNRASEVLLDFLSEANYPQYISLIAPEPIDGRPTYIYENPLDLLFKRVNYPIYRPLDPAELSYLRLKHSHERPVFSGIFPFRRVHPRELGAYLLSIDKRFPRKMRGDKARDLVLSLEARYPRLIVSAASFVEKVSKALEKHVSLEKISIEPQERRLIRRRFIYSTIRALNSSNSSTEPSKCLKTKRLSFSYPLMPKNS